MLEIKEMIRKVVLERWRWGDTGEEEKVEGRGKKRVELRGVKGGLCFKIVDDDVFYIYIYN